MSGTTSRFLRKLIVFNRLACYLAAALLIVSCVSTVRAQWTGGVEGGTVVQDAGNATRLRLVLRNNEKPLSHYLFAEWLRSVADENSYSVGYNPRYWFSAKYYLFGESEFGTDDIFSIEQEVTLVTGVGGQFINSESQGLYAEAGVGGRSIEFDDDDSANTEALGVVRAGYYRTIAETVKLDVNVNGSRSDADVSRANSEVGLALRISGGSVRVAYRNRYIRVGDADLITDNDTYISYGYSF